MTTSQAIDQLRLVLRRQHKALSTEKSYIHWLRRYIPAVLRMPRGLSSEQRLERFLSELARERDVSASTQNQAFNALLYFYKEVLGQTLGNVNALRAQRPVHQRHAPTVAETQALLAEIGNEGGYPVNLVARLLYGCGLRVTEPLNLRIKDIDLEQRSLCIRGAKGGNDRVVPLPDCLIPELTQQMEVARVVWQRDQQDRTPLMLPHRLARKYPECQFSWGWAWLFPAHHPCRDPRTGMFVRFRMHEANVQRAVKRAALQLGISVLPHELRHHSECRIIPIGVRGTSKNVNFSWVCDFSARNNPAVLFLNSRNPVKGKDIHDQSLFCIRDNTRPRSTWPSRAVYRWFCQANN